ncbi:hypothetical protein, partial [Halobacterium hubeiense]
MGVLPRERRKVCRFAATEPQVKVEPLGVVVDPALAGRRSVEMAGFTSQRRPFHFHSAPPPFAVAESGVGQRRGGFDAVGVVAE